MKKWLLVCLFACFLCQQSLAWGFYAHKKINRLAVFTLPPQLLEFYKPNIEFVTEHAVDPDKRRYAVKGEACKHYIDLDQYGQYPFANLPKAWKQAAEKHSEDTLRKHGILPWNILWMMNNLTEAFKAKDKYKILKYSAELGHYLGDAHVPLHTTKNYNGQLTNQHGIHGFWESRLPELFAVNYDYWVGQSTEIKQPFNWVWNIVLTSHSYVDSVLLIEQRLSETYAADQKFVFDNRGTVLLKTYSANYSEAYHKALNHMVEQRMVAAIKSVGSVWYTCWVQAGKPNLTNIVNAGFSDEAKKEMEENEHKYQNKGHIHGREHTENGNNIK